MCEQSQRVLGTAGSGAGAISLRPATVTMHAADDPRCLPLSQTPGTALQLPAIHPAGMAWMLPPVSSCKALQGLWYMAPRAALRCCARPAATVNWRGLVQGFDCRPCLVRKLQRTRICRACAG